MGGGGHVIIRNSMKVALQDPLVHGLIPTNELDEVDAILAKDVNDWSEKETHKVSKVFQWIANHT